MNKIKEFFKSKQTFKDEEFILKYQISTFILMSFFFSLYIYYFSILRYLEGNIIVSISQIIFASFLMYGFIRLKKDKDFYILYTSITYFLFIIYLFIIFFNVPSNTLNILWIQSTTVMVFFFLNKKFGLVMFVIILLFISYLIYSQYNYNTSEYITLIGSFCTVTYMMYVYENLKSEETKRLSNYTITLQNEIKKRTNEIQRLNDILEVKLQEEINKNIKQEQILIRQSRLSHMGEMIDTIAHQWKQPLMEINSILMNLDINMKLNENNKNQINNKIDDISFITSHMAQTIEDFRDLFKEKKEKKDFYLIHSFNIVQKILTNQLSNINIINDIDKNIKIYNNENELIQVFLILFTNAIEALQIQNIKYKRIYLNAVIKNNMIDIIIQDNANGIMLSNINDIFEYNVSTKNKKNKRGIGLYIAKTIILNNMKGNISVKNVNNGAKFIISISK